MRIRTVKPEFWKHPILTKVDPMVRLLALALLNYADDEGYFYADPDAVRGDLMFREDSKNVLGWLQDLSKLGYIQLCESPESGTLGKVINFTKHQRVDKPRDSSIAPLWDSKNILGTFQDDSKMAPAGKERKGKEGKEGIVLETNLVPAKPKPSDAVNEIFTYWATTMGHEKSKLDPKRTKMIEAALKLGYTVDQLKQAIEGNKRSPFHQGQNDRSTRYDGLDLILRDASKIDSFIAMAEGRAFGGQTLDEFANEVEAQAARIFGHSNEKVVS